MRRKGKSEISKCKDRIQKLLTLCVRARDKDCLLKGKYQRCAGYTAADHILSRTYHNTYGELDNVICLCNAHHIFWKPRNPTLYTEEIKSAIGEERWMRIHALAKKQTAPFSIKEWLDKEEILKKRLDELSHIRRRSS